MNIGEIILDENGYEIKEAKDVDVNIMSSVPILKDVVRNNFIPKVFDETSGLSVPLDLTPSSKLLKKYILTEGFGDHHIEVYDKWINSSAHHNVKGKSLLLSGNRVVCFENLHVLQPRYTRDGKVFNLTPKLAREQGITYGGDWHVDVVIREGDCKGRILERKDGFCIGTVPTMLKSQTCFLHGKSKKELALLGEDPDDPGGYFIVSGVEKVVLLQERLVVNKLFLMDMDSKGGTVARLTANTIRGTALIELALDRKTGTIIKMRFPSMREQKKKKEKNNPGKDEKYKSLNVLRVFRLLGYYTIDSIKDFLKMFIKPEHFKKCMLKLTRNFVEYTVLPNDTEIILNKIGKAAFIGKDVETKAEIDRILDADLFPHLNELQGLDGETESQRIFRIQQSKTYLLGIMVSRFLEYIAGYRELDDRDSWSNKRTDGAGRMMEQLFRNAWRKTLGIATGAIGDSIVNLNGVLDKIHANVITDTFHDSFITSNWGVRGTRINNNVAQTLVRDSVIATFAHINTINVNISRTVRKQSLRLIQNSQYGFVCPASTPEGENAGLLKNLSITTKVSLERDGKEIIRLLIGDREKGLEPMTTMDYNNQMGWRNGIIVDGKPLGWCDAAAVHKFLVDMRRYGRIVPQDMSVVREDNWLFVDISPSRLVRPLLIVNEDQTLAIDNPKLNAREQSNHFLLTNGCMEYISAWEQEYIKVATSYDKIVKRLQDIRDATERYTSAIADLEAITEGQTIFKEDIEGEVLTFEEANKRVNSAEEVLTKAKSIKPYTHCELDPLAILGVAAAMIPWPNHNQAPRNTYQVSMGKQALGDYHSNHLNRFDGKMKTLAFPNRPMVETEMHDIIGLSRKGTGENVYGVFAALPYTEEDAFVVKKEFLDYGGFRMYKYLTYKTVVKHHSGSVTEELTKPARHANEPITRYDGIQMYEEGNLNNGLPKLGCHLNQGDCVIGKTQTIESVSETRNESVFLRVGDEGVVEKVLVTSDNKTTIVTVKLRIMRVPQEGDKFAPRNAQKGTIGLVESDVNLLVDENGIIPDIYMNPHQMPSRMTVSYLMEIQASKSGAVQGKNINGTAFKPFNLNHHREVLRERNRKVHGDNLKREHEFGYEFMRSGTSGKKLDVPMYSGPVFFQTLKHQVKDKYQARGTGQFKPMTRQPPKGRGNRGGLRFGEMERDAAISHGASAFLMERLMYVSDAYQMAFCRICGQPAVNNAVGGYKPCRLCKNDDSFGRVTIPYVYKLLIHLLAAPGMNLSPELLSSDEVLEKILSKAETSGGDINNIRETLDEIDAAQGDEQREIDEIDEDINDDYYQ